MIGAPHPKWDERQLLIVVRKPEVDAPGVAAISCQQDRQMVAADDVLFLDELPHTSKVQKAALRARFGQHRLASAAE